MSAKERTPQAGFAAAEWAVGLALIVLPLVMIVGSVAPWHARQTMAREISQEAARSLALAADWEAGLASSNRLAATIAANYGLDEGDWGFVIIGTDPAGMGLVRGVDVVVEVRVRIPALTIPGIGSLAEVWWHTRHVEHVDDFRSFP